ncbi:Predicted ATPase, AAA+ ATPase superfamily [Geopseudomonas sagittaria]|uniref:Predicted ATPase, AAA+ ATPase superfamily n=2 Tax=Geopseudomonas sagittaria TaxID=1135990 RepID=A0A1I5TCU9_9GAMM|nr:Predicted ATPase, AAA+ ATPase superfamily [Pseudomonas sagittaria]
MGLQKTFIDSAERSHRQDTHSISATTLGIEVLIKKVDNLLISHINNRSANAPKGYKMAINFHPDAEPQFEAARQTTQETAVPFLELLSSCFQINWFRETGQNLWLAVIKPSPAIAEHFGLTHEYFVIGNGYPDDFHQRTLKQDPPSAVVDRLDLSTRFVASNAPRADAFSAAWAQKNKSTVIVLKTLERCETTAADQLYKILSGSLWRRDFFAESEPVRDPSEFFGREVIVNELHAKIIFGSPIAIFGLRKIGKSSVLGRLENLIEQDDSSISVTASLIGNSTRLKSGRWWDAAQDAISAWQLKLQRLAAKLGSKVHPKAERLRKSIEKKEAGTRNLAIAFERDIISLLKAAKALKNETDRDSVQLVLFLDECDHFYPHLTDSGHWRTDFFDFWNALQGIKRSLESPEELVYVLGGVNPSGVEQGSLLGQANPLYETQRIYLGPMTKPEADSLLIGLGRRMGLDFDPTALEASYNFVGGHPLLIRRLGSAVHENALNRAERIKVTARDVDRAFKKKKRDLFNQVAWFLEHLARVAPDEERLLRDIAQGGSKTYSDLWGDDIFRETYAYHLERYGLLEFKSELPKISLSLVKDALQRPVATEFTEQKKQLKDVVEAIEQAVRIRLRMDLERDNTPEEAVLRVVNAVPSDAKNRAMSRQDLIDLGSIAGVGAVLDSLNWGDYEILFEKHYNDINWSGPAMEKTERTSNIKSAFTDAHLVRHNNDHQLKSMLDTEGFNLIYERFSRMRDALRLVKFRQNAG